MHYLMITIAITAVVATRSKNHTEIHFQRFCSKKHYSKFYISSIFKSLIIRETILEFFSFRLIKNKKKNITLTWQVSRVFSREREIDKKKLLQKCLFFIQHHHGISSCYFCLSEHFEPSCTLVSKCGCCRDDMIVKN